MDVLFTWDLDQPVRDFLAVLIGPNALVADKSNLRILRQGLQNVLAQAGRLHDRGVILAQRNLARRALLLQIGELLRVLLLQRGLVVLDRGRLRPGCGSRFFVLIACFSLGCTSSNLILDGLCGRFLCIGQRFTAIDLGHKVIECGAMFV